MFSLNEARDLIRQLVRDAYLKEGTTQFWVGMVKHLMGEAQAVKCFMCLVEGGCLNGRASFASGEEESLFAEEFESREEFSLLLERFIAQHGADYMVQLVFTVSDQWGGELKEGQKRAREREDSLKSE